MDVMKKVPVREQDPKVRATNFEEVCYGYNEEEAVAEAERCLNCKNARCVEGCPVNIDIPTFIREVKERKFEDAANTIALSSALPAVCGRVCPQESQCEGKCIRGIKGESISIGKLERFVADWSRENGIVPEKCDLNSILFLLTPAESHEKLAQLVAMLAQFEQHIEDDSPLAEVLPSVYNKYPVRYRDYTLRQLCQEMHDLYVSFDVKDLQKAMFRQQSFPSVVMNPQDAHSAYIRGEVELVRIRDAEGRIAAEGALPYPPGVLCVVPGEVWGGAVQRYFLALEEGVNLLPGFSPELQGVYSETDADGMKRLYGYVLK